MATIQGSKLVFVKPFDNREHRCVDKADLRVGIAVANLAHPWVILRQKTFDLIRSRRDVIQQRDERANDA